MLLFFAWKIAYQRYDFCCYFQIVWDFMSTLQVSCQKLSPSDFNLTIFHPFKKKYQISVSRWGEISAKYVFFNTYPPQFFLKLGENNRLPT